MSFIRTDDLPRLQLFPKALSGIVQGENLMLSFLDLAPGCRIPEHSHPHEQAGLVLSGRLRFRIGEEERLTAPGDAFLVPPNVVHEGEVIGDETCRVLDIFSPVREDYLERYNRYTETSGETRWR